MIKFLKHQGILKEVKEMAAKSTVPFQGTKEQEAQLRSVIAELKDERGALMPILQKAQDIYGYLPIEVQTMIADECGISSAVCQHAGRHHLRMVY